MVFGHGGEIACCRDGVVNLFVGRGSRNNILTVSILAPAICNRFVTFLIGGNFRNIGRIARRILLTGRISLCCRLLFCFLRIGRNRILLFSAIIVKRKMQNKEQDNDCQCC